MEEKISAENNRHLLKNIRFPEPQNEISIDVVDLIKRIKPYWVRFCCIGLACIIAAVVWTLTSVSYQATEKLYVTSGSNSLVDLSALQIGSTLSADYIELFRNKEIHEQVRQSLGLEYTDEQLEKMLLLSNPTARIITITVTSSKSEYEALRMVEEYGEAVRSFIENRMDQKLPTIFEKPMLVKSGRGLVVAVFIALILGGVLPVIVWLAFYLLDDRIKNRKRIEQELEIPVLGVLAKK